MAPTIHSQTRISPKAIQRQEQLRTGLAAALDRTVSDPSTWWKITRLISFGGVGSANRHIFTHDLTRRPGWLLLSATEQERVLDDGELPSNASTQPR